MNKYVAEILKQLDIIYEDYDIQYHKDEESGDVWYTFHPKRDGYDSSTLAGKLTNLQERMYGKYTVRWSESSCYLKVNGVIEISDQGKQIWPVPMVDRPVIFSQKYLLELWDKANGITVDR